MTQTHMPTTARDEYYDCSGKIGPLDGSAEWPMYSYSRGGWLLWAAIARDLHKAGWTEDQIRDWLQSKESRWALDGALGAVIEDAGKRYARQTIKLRGK